MGGNWSAFLSHIDVREHILGRGFQKYVYFIVSLICLLSDWNQPCVGTWYWGEEPFQMGGHQLFRLLFSCLVRSLDWRQAQHSIGMFRKCVLNYNLAHTVTPLPQDTRAPEATASHATYPRWVVRDMQIELEEELYFYPCFSGPCT